MTGWDKKMVDKKQGGGGRFDAIRRELGNAKHAIEEAEIFLAKSEIDISDVFVHSAIARVKDAQKLLRGAHFCGGVGESG